jgi:hypothetical protein
MASMRERVLKTALEVVTKDRNTTHGNPEDTFKVIADYWNVYLTERLETLVELDGHDVAMLQLLLKVGRAHNGFHLDNYVDIAGYSACAAEVDYSATEESDS